MVFKVFFAHVIVKIGDFTLYGEKYAYFDSTTLTAYSLSDSSI